MGEKFVKNLETLRHFEKIAEKLEEELPDKENVDAIYEFALWLRCGIPGMLDPDPKRAEEYLAKVFTYMMYTEYFYPNNYFYYSEDLSEDTLRDYCAIAQKYKEVFKAADFWMNINPSEQLYEMATAFLCGIEGALAPNPQKAVEMFEHGLNPQGLIGGYELVDTVLWSDKCRRALGDCYLNGLGVEKDLLAAYLYYINYHSDHIAQKHLDDEIKDRFDILFAELSKAVIENPDDGRIHLALFAVLAEGLGCKADPVAAETHYLLAVQLEEESDIENDPYFGDLHKWLLSILSKNPRQYSVGMKYNVGDFIYLGKYNHRDILWKVLDPEYGPKKKSLVLISDQALESDGILWEKALPGTSVIARFAFLDLELDSNTYALLTLSEEKLMKYLPNPEDRMCLWRNQALKNSTDEEESGFNVPAGWFWFGPYRDGRCSENEVSANGKLDDDNDLWGCDGVRPIIVFSGEGY